MLRSGDVVWEPDREAADKLTRENSERKSRNRRHTSKQKPLKNGLANFDPSEIGGKSSNTSCTTNNGVTLKDLNREDKQKIAHLVIELAKIGEEKENVVNDERQQFLSHVRQFEDEKNMLMSKQHFLAEEVKQCQTLLQYYQNLITTQQTSILAHEESQRLSSHVDMTSEKHQKSSPSRHLDAGAINAEEFFSQTGGIKVNDISSGSSGMSSVTTTNSSITDDEVLRMSERQYNIYLQRKKEKLKKEQKNLRKLLKSKVQSDTELEDIKISQVHPCDPNRSEESQSSKRSIEKGYVPVKAISPIWNNETSSYLAPSRTTSNKTHHKSYKSSQSSETLKRSTSPANIFHILSQNITNEGMQENFSASLPLSERISNLSLSSSDAGIATNVMNCDDSQILEDIFFV